VDYGERFSGILCVAVLVFNRHGYPLASLWTTGLNDRLQRSDFLAVGALVSEHARSISGRLGYGPHGNNNTTAPCKLGGK
jgi:DNA-binding IclR family transcriptional regulator